jgi:hypothetical protein
MKVAVGFIPRMRVSEVWRRGATLEDQRHGCDEKKAFKRRYATQTRHGTHRGLKATATFERSLGDLETTTKLKMEGMTA